MVCHRDRSLDRSFSSSTLLFWQNVESSSANPGRTQRCGSFGVPTSSLRPRDRCRRDTALAATPGTGRLQTGAYGIPSAERYGAIVPESTRSGIKPARPSPVTVVIHATAARSDVVANIYLAERMASAEREPITGVWGQSPQRGPGAEPLVGVRGRSPPEAEKVLRFGHAMETANLPYNSLYFGN